MTNELREEVLSSDFPAYRRAEIEVAASFIKGLRVGTENNDYCKGAMDLFRKIINIPWDAAKTKEQSEIISKRINDDFARFEAEYLRKAVRDD